MVDGKVRKIHHIGFSVHDAKEVLQIWEKALGIKGVLYEYKGPEKVMVGSIDIGGVAISFNQPIDPDDTSLRCNRFLKEHGEGFEHIALEVDDITAFTIEAKKNGMAFLLPEPEKAFEGKSNHIPKVYTRVATVEILEPQEESSAKKNAGESSRFKVARDCDTR